MAQEPRTLHRTMVRVAHALRVVRAENRVAQA